VARETLGLLLAQVTERDVGQLHRTIAPELVVRSSVTAPTN
jgi:DNA-binding LacI/PurR family transcriptional regulator